MMEQLRSLARILEFSYVASIQAADSVPQIKKFFGMLLSLWKLFYYSPQKAEKLKMVQSVLNLPELKDI